MSSQLVKKQDFKQDDLINLFHYPTIGELFSDGNSQRLDELRQKLDNLREDLERIIRHGKPDETQSAIEAIRAIEVTLDFLQTLQEIRPFHKK